MADCLAEFPHPRLVDSALLSWGECLGPIGTGEASDGTEAFQTGLLVRLLVNVLGSVGCDVEVGLQVLDGVGAEQPAGSPLDSLAAGEATHIYYQFVDDRNQVAEPAAHLAEADPSARAALSAPDRK